MTHLHEPLERGDLVIKPAGTFVYVVHDWAGRVLYVGLTDDICQRMASHRTTARWWPNAQRVEWEIWPTRRRAGQREVELIQQHDPAWNVQMNGPRREPAYDAASWARLGAAVRAGRTSGRLTQVALAGEAGLEVAVVRAIERAEEAAARVEDLARLERPLSWRAGSVEAVLAGGDPVPLTPEERAERARAAARGFLEVQVR